MKEATSRPPAGDGGNDAPAVAEIRAHFPALERRHDGRPVAYFDGPGGTQVPRAVVEAISDYLYQHNANTHLAYPASAETDRILEDARLALADFLHAAPSEIEGVRLYGPPPGVPRTPTVAFTVAGVASTLVAQELAARGLFLSHGDFYAATVIERLELGVEGLLRAGCACYTTVEEVERLIRGVAEIARRA